MPRDKGLRVKGVPLNAKGTAIARAGAAKPVAGSRAIARVTVDPVTGESHLHRVLKSTVRTSAKRRAREDARAALRGNHRHFAPRSGIIRFARSVHDLLRGARPIDDAFDAYVVRAVGGVDRFIGMEREPALVLTATTAARLHEWYCIFSNLVAKAMFGTMRIKFASRLDIATAFQTIQGTCPDNTALTEFLSADLPLSFIRKQASFGTDMARVVAAAAAAE